MSMENEKVLGLVLVTPFIFLFLAFAILPLFVNVYYSFTNYKVGGEAKFVGLNNFNILLNDPTYRRALINTAIPFEYNKIDEFLNLISRYKKNIAAVIMEPIRNFYPKEGFLETIRSLTQEEKIVLIFDEVSSGWRLNVGGAHIVFGIDPDIAVFSKGISNGYPMAAIIGRSSIMGSAENSFISSTYWTERIGPTAALATIKKMKENDVPNHLIRIGKIIQEEWRNLAGKHDLKVEISGIPPLSHFSFDYKDHLVLKTLFTQLMLERGFLATNAFYASHAHTERHVQEYLKAVDESFYFVREAIEEGNPYKYLKGPVCQSGFRRLA